MYAIKAAKRKWKGTSDRDRMLKEVYALAALSDVSQSHAFHIVRYGSDEALANGEERSDKRRRDCERSHDDEERSDDYEQRFALLAKQILVAPFGVFENVAQTARCAKQF